MKKLVPLSTLGRQNFPVTFTLCVRFYKQTVATAILFLLLANKGNAQCIPFPNVSNSGCDTLTATGLVPGGQGSNSSGVLYLNGASQYLQTGITSLAGSAITIEYWFKGTNCQSAVRQQNGGNYISAGWSNPPIHILSDDGGTGNGLRVDATGTTVIYNGQWHHVAMTWQQNTTNGFCSYLDGVLQQQRNSANVTLTNIGANVLIGSYVGSGEFTTGDMDNIRIWNVARTQAQIQTDMFLETPSNSTGLVAQFKLNGDFTCSNNAAYNATAINSPVFAAPNFYTYTWTGPNAPTASTNEAQIATLNTSTQTYSCVASYSGYSTCAGSPNSTTIGPCSYASANPSFLRFGGISTLTLGGYGTGGSIQWMQSTDGVTWVPVTGGSGGTTNTYTTGSISVTTYYEAVVTGGTQPGTSNVVPVTVPQYCTPPANISNSCTYLWITNVAISGTTLNNTSGCNAPYINYPDTGAATAELIAGNTYTISLSDAFPDNRYFGTPKYFSVWIDANQDGIFETNEQVVTDLAVTGSGYISFMVPPGAVAGPAVMRVREDYNYPGNPNGSTPILDNPCAATYYGETEDYTVQILPVASASPDRVWCTGSNTTLSISNYVGGTVQWQVATSNSPYNWQNISGGTTSSYTTAVSATSYYQAIVTNAGIPDTSQAITVSISSPANVIGISGATTLSVNGTTTLCVHNPSGGTVTTAGGYRIHTFTSNGTFNVPAGFNNSVDVLLVAGGGGGGANMGGGGGGGGVLYNTNFALSPGSFPVVVGNGGLGAPAGLANGQQPFQAGTNGGNSAFSSLTAIGGGHGGMSPNSLGDGINTGTSGGSGGGASGYNDNGSALGAVTGGATTAGQGHRGGNQGNAYYSGGGGGADGPGWDGNNQANGGPGVLNSILGTPYYWGGGGGGSGHSINGGNGGLGGGGGGAIGTTTGGAGLNNGSPGAGGATNSQANEPGGNGGANTGGGGGGGSHYDRNNQGGNGGSGIVVVRYPDINSATGTWASDNTSVATVDPSTGVVTGISAGTANISYSVTSGSCNIQLQSVPVTVAPASISLCVNGIASAGINSAAATGGTVTTAGGYRIHTFTSSGTFTAPSGFNGKAEVLVVGGGGGGGVNMGGGGGGGGVIYSTNFSISPGVITVTVGAGGAGAPAGLANGQQPTQPGTNGGNSVFSSLTAIGGGRGGMSLNSSGLGISAGVAGGSGGGASGYNDNGSAVGAVTGGAGTAGQGYAGGNQGVAYYSGGGGGAGGPGSSGDYTANGGPGILNSILGTPYYWGGGGGGSGFTINGGNGGIGGGGGGAVGTTFGGAGLNNGSPGGGGNTNSQTNEPGGNGGANTGGGGGGGSHYDRNNQGGNGGSGIVVVRYPLATWSCSDTNIATVDSAGNITGIAPGTAFITYSLSSGSCSNTQAIAVTVSAAQVGTPTATSPGVCYGSGTTISLTGNSGTSVQWQQSADGLTGWTNATGGSGATTTTYTTPVLTSLTYYRAQSTGACNGNSAVVPVNVTPTPPYITYGTTAPQTISVNGTNTVCIANALVPTGGLVSNSGGYRVHIFTSGGNFIAPTGFNANVEVLVVGGGGGGGSFGGGGGAGGVVYSDSVPVTAGTYAVTVGSGGAPATSSDVLNGNGANGSNSVFNSLTAIGGGGGGTREGGGQGYLGAPGSNGGSGGGGANSDNAAGGLGGSGTAGQGFAGGAGGSGTTGVPNYSHGGGGGAGGIGMSGKTNGSAGAAGGIGLQFPQFAAFGGSPAGWFGGGGGGGIYTNGTTGLGGMGGGGNGGDNSSSNLQATAGVANTGGGGGGARYQNAGGAGGSGIVIIKYLDITSYPGVWSSDNTTVATVNATTGVVTGVSAGTANMNYSVSIGSCNFVVQTVPFTVTAAIPALCVNAKTPSGIVVPSFPLPTGGTITTVGGYRIHTFDTTGVLTIPSGFTNNLQALVVAGGGGGGGSSANDIAGGGGGAGGLIYNPSVNGLSGAVSVTVGAGGNGANGFNVGSNGGNSIFGPLTALGGGYGGTWQVSPGSGGSGGGAGENGQGYVGANGTAGQGYGGGNGNPYAQPYASAGGGGGGAGGAGATETSNVNGGAGGNGLAYSISGSSVYYAGGGGGGGYTTAGAGGLGGGGNGAAVNSGNGYPATPNTGGGGGGALTNYYDPTYTGGTGGSGIVIIRYPNPSVVWSSSNNAVATVDTSGVITGVGAGSATITCTIVNGSCTTVQTVAVSVNSSQIGTAAATPAAICAGSTTNINLTGNSGSAIQWQQSADGNTGWASVIGGSGSTTANYTTASLATTTYYRVQATGLCYGNSAPVQVSVTILPSRISYGVAGANSIPVNGSVALCGVTVPTGGTVTTSGGYRIHTFTSNGTFKASDGFSANVAVLVVAGGGGGGSDMGGGGGGGGVIYNSSLSVSGSEIPVIVGAGGAGASAGSNQLAGSNGGNSAFSSLLAIGGGGGGSEYSNNNYPAGNGGSGGGTAGPNSSPGTGTAGQGYSGGGSLGQWYPGGGGGAGGPGSTAPATGGPGVYNDITGTGYYWGGGGGGSGYSGFGGNGGIGGGGGGAVGTTTGGAGLNNGLPGGGGGINGCVQTPGGNAGANTGGGGGGGSYCNSNNYGGNGGSGIVVVKYPDITNGQWSSDNTSVATVNPSTGVVTGIDTGTANISYSYNYGACIIVLRTYPITVTAPVTPICINGSSPSGITFPVFTPATGGTVSVSGGYRIHTFTTTNDTLSVPTGFSNNVDVLVVAGGGGGGSDMGGGGGGGGVIYQTNYSVASGSVPVSVGSGGFGAPAGSGEPAGTNGGNSVFGSITALGGGGGGSEYSNNNSPAGNGGSGGGTAGPNSLPGNGTSGQGFSGGRSIGQWYPGGGGGAGGPGTDNPGNGGPGVFNDILGTGYYWGGGGGGSGYSGNGGNGGIGGGGGGAVGVTTGGAGLNNGLAGGGGGTNGCVNTPGGSAGAHTGGGGGGGSYCNNNNQGGKGGSGIVIVRYANLAAVWSSSNTAVATVDTLGNVTGVSSGNAVITCTVTNGSCTNVFSSPVQIYPITISTVSTTNPSLCIGDSTSVFLNGSAGGESIQWQQSADGVSGWGNVTGGTGSTSSTYFTPSLTTSTYYRVEATGACASSSPVVSVTIVAPPSITLGTSPVCSGGATIANLPYTDTTGSPDRYSVTYDATAQGVGFNNINLNTFTNSPLALPVPGSAPSGTYNGTLTVTNSSAGCASTPVAFTITVLSGCIGSNPGNTLSTAYAANPGVTFTLSLSNIPSPVSGVSCQWQSSTDNITYTNIGGATGVSYTTSETVSTWYRCVTTCTSGGTGTSVPVQISDCGIPAHAQDVISQPFNNASLPTGWTDTVMTGSHPWTFTSSPALNSLSGGNYAVFNDNAGAYGPSAAALVTPSMNFLNRYNVKLSYYTYWFGVELTHGLVEISNDGGITWDTLRNYQLTTVGSLAVPAHEQIDISAYAGNQCNVVVRFVYSDGGQAGQSWYLDDMDFYDAVDVGVTSLTAPGYLSCSTLYGSSQPVTVTVENYSLDSISNVPVTCQITGGITRTITGTYAGTIPGQTTVSYTFPVTVNLSADAEYTFKVFTQVSNDSYHANDTLVDGRHQLVSDYSYFENFNSSNGGWQSGTTGTDTARYFAWGPIPYLNGPQGNGNSWYLNIEDNGWNGDVWVQSPVFDLTGLTSPELSMSIKSNLDDINHYYSWDGIQVYYSTNNGVNWNLLGSPSDPDWYNGYSSLGNNDGSAPITNWTRVQHSLCSLIGQSCVIFRITTTTTYWGGADAEFALDNFKIQNANDVGVTAILNPVASGCLYSDSQQAQVTVFNTGCTPVSNIPVTFVVKGAANQILTGTIPGPIAANSSANYTLPGTFDMSGLGTYNFRAFTTLASDSNNLNDSTPLMTITTVQPKIATFPYTQHFDTSDGYWLLPPYSGDTSRHFTWGVVPYLGGANGQGNSIYLSSPNNEWTDVWAESPVFDFTNITDPMLSMDIQYNLSNPYNNGWNEVIVQYTLNGGANWATLGSSSDAGWYNAYGSLGNNDGSAQQTNWTHIQHDLCVVSGESCVKFRVSTYNLYWGGTYAEFAFDNFGISAGGKDDIQPLEITMPGSGYCGTYPAGQAVTVDIQNNTCRPMYNVPITLQMTGTGAATLNEVVPGPIPGLGRYLYTFNGTLNMTGTGNYNLSVTTNLATDSFPANNTRQEFLTSNTPVTSYPYVANFDADNGGWVGHTTDSSRLWRRDSVPYLNGPQGSGKSWYLDVEDNAWGGDIWIESPVFDISALNNPVLTMDIKANLDDINHYYSWDGVQVFYSLNGGANWTLLGSPADPDWYNGYSSLGNNDGSAAITNWKLVEHSLGNLLGQSCVKLALSTNTLYWGTADAEFAFDNFKIQDGVDVGVTSILEPVSNGCLYSNAQQAAITVFNYGTAAVTNVPVIFVVTGATNQILTGTVPGPIAGNSSVSYTFPGTLDMSGIGTYFVQAFSSLTGDVNNTNDSTAVIPITTVQPKIATFPYIQKFDTSDGYWLLAPFSGDTSRHFTWGAVPYLGGPEGQGNSIYLSSANNYEWGDVWAESPVFDFTNVTDPQLGMDIQFNLNNPYNNGWNAVIIEYTLNGGSNWTTLGSNSDSGWYNNFGSLGNNNGADSATTWTHIQHDLCIVSGQSCVKFRVTTINWLWGAYEEFAFDNFNISSGGKDDIEPLEIVMPNSGYCGTYPANQAVTVDIQNNTCRTLYNVPVTLQMSGAGSATFNEVMPGPIPGSGRYLYTFTGTLNMTGTGTYNLSVTTNLATDSFSANNTRQEVLVSNTPVASYPYVQNFDSDNGGWVGHTTDSSRLWRRDSLPYLNGPQGNGKSWYVDIEDNAWGGNVWVESPVFNLAGLTNPTLSMEFKSNLDDINHYYSWDGIQVFYSLDGGNNWTLLGSNADPQWYNYYSSLGNNDGSPAETSWTIAQHSLCPVVGQTCVKLALSTVTTYWGGADAYFAFDNFKVRDAIEDVGATSVTAPVASGCLYSTTEQAQITVFNLGCTPATNVPVQLVISGAVNKVLTGSVPGPIAGNTSVTYTFPTTFDMTSIGTYNFVGITSLTGDSNQTNDTTPVYSLTVSQPRISTFPYVQKFDTSNGEWLTPSTSGDTSRHFTWGAVPYLGGAEGQGNSMYLSVPNNGWYGDVWAESPVFDFTNLTNPMLSLDYQADLEDISHYYSWGGIQVQYSTNGGANWYQLGSSSDPNWYNGYNSFGNNDGSAAVTNWTYEQHNLCSLAGQSCVKFRVSTYTLYWGGADAEFAFDNFKIVNAPIDAQMVSVTGCYGSAYQMEATVRNNNITCTTPANITSINISYTINGGAPVTQNFTGLNIAPGQAETITIPNILIPDNTETVQVWCWHPNGVSDQLQANDSIYANVAIWPNCNEHCSNAILLKDEVTLASQNTFSVPTASEDSSIFDNCTPGVTIEDPAWYYFITDCSGKADVSFTNIHCSPSATGIQVAIEQLKPGLSACVLSNYINVFCDNPLNDSDIVWHGTSIAPNSTFYITIDGQGGNQCTFDIVVNHLVDTILPATGVNIVNDSTCASVSKILSPIGGSDGATGVWAWFADSACTSFLDTGSIYTVSPSVTTNYWVRAENLCDTTPVANATVVVLQPPTIITNPLSSTICDGQNTSYTVAAASIAPVTYQWQVSADAGNTFSDITTGGNGPAYSGYTSSILQLTGAVFANNGFQYRCRAMNACGNDTSSAVPLVVNALPSVTLGATPSICYSADSQTINLTYSANTGSPNNYSIVWNAFANNAGFMNVSASVLLPGSIVIPVTGAALAGTYNGNLSLNNNITGCSTNAGTPFSLTVLSTPDAFVVSGGACVPAIMGLNGSESGIMYQLQDSANGTLSNVGSALAGTGSALSFGSQNTAGIYSVVATDVSDGCVAEMTGVSTVGICTSTWTGATSSDWFTSTNWDPAAVPDNCAANVVIPFGTPHNPIISGAASVQIGNMNIAAGVTLFLQGRDINVCGNWTGGDRLDAYVIGSGTTYINGSTAQTIDGYTRFGVLQINNNSGNGISLLGTGNVSIITGLHLQSGVLNVASDATLRLLSAASSNNSYIDDFTPNFSGQVTGVVTADRYVSVFGDNQHFVSSPVNTPSFSQLHAWGPDGSYVIPSYNCDETVSAYGSPYGNVFQYNDGHMAPNLCMLGNWQIRSAGNTVNGLGYSVYLYGDTTVSLSASANTGDMSVGNLNNSGYPTVNTLQGDPIESGWNLVGNPYPSALDLTIDRTADGFGNQVQIWQTSGPFSGSWQPLMITGNSGAVVIPPFQAFMVRVTPGSTGMHTYNFHQAERVRNTNVPFYRTQSENALSLNVDYNNMKDVTTVSFNPSATYDYDGQYDADKQDGSPGRPTLYTYFTNQQMWYAINTLPALTQTATVPVGLRPENNGTMTITPQGIESFDPTTYIYLEDKKTGIWANMRDGAYTFTTTKADNQSRFVLHFTPPAIILTQDASCEQPGMINIEQPGSANWNYTVTDNNNVTVSGGVLNSGSPATISVNVGVYTITLRDNTGYTVIKTVQVEGSQPVVASFGVSETTAQVADNILFASSTTNATSYTWDFDDGTSANGKSTSHSYNSQGVYVVTLTVTSADGCTSTTSQTITVTQAVATGTINLPDDKLNIWSYDNTVFVDFTKTDKVDAEVQLYDVLGQLLSDERFGKSTVYSKQLVNTGEAAYIVVKVTNDDRITSKKVFIANVNK